MDIALFKTIIAWLWLCAGPH